MGKEKILEEARRSYEERYGSRPWEQTEIEDADQINNGGGYNKAEEYRKRKILESARNSYANKYGSRPWETDPRYMSAEKKKENARAYLQGMNEQYFGNIVTPGNGAQAALDDEMMKNGALNPNSSMSRLMREVDRPADSYLKIKPLIDSMTDEQVAFALRSAEQNQIRADQKYMSASPGMIVDPTQTQTHKDYQEVIDAYSAEADKRKSAAVEQERQENLTKYQNKRNDALKTLTKEQMVLLDEYVDASYTRDALINAAGVNQWAANNKEIYAATTQMQEAEQALKASGVENLPVLAQYRSEMKDEEATVKLNEGTRDFVDEHPVVGGTLLSATDILTSPVAGLTATAESLKRASYADPEAPVNTNSGLYALSNLAAATESAVNGKIDNPVGRFAYNVGMSTAKSALSAAIGGKVTGALGLTGKEAKEVGKIVTLTQYGASAYATTLQQDQARGISTENATKHALAAGMNEALGELFSLDYIWGIARGSGSKAAKQVIIDTLVGAGIEGIEEGTTDLANAIADRIINGDMSEYTQSVRYYMDMGNGMGMSAEEAKKAASKDFFADVAQDVLAGAISGGIMTGGANAVAYHNYQNLGAHANADTQMKSEVIEAAKQMPEDTVARQIVESKSAEEIDSHDMATILSSVDEEAENEQLAQIEKKFIERGESEQQAKADAKEVRAAVTKDSEHVGVVENAARAKKFEQNENLQAVYVETLKEQSASPADVSGKVRRSYEADKFYNRADKKQMPGVAKAVDTRTGENVVVVKVARTAPHEETMVEMSDGSVRNLSEIEIADKEMQSLYNFATTMDNAYAGNALIERYAGEIMPSYLEACAVFYNAGKLGATSFESMLHNPKNAALVSSVSNPATLQMMYVQGENVEKLKVAPVQQEKTAKQEQKEENYKADRTKKTGQVVDNRLDRADNRIKSVAEQVAKKTGLTITLNDELEHGENGNFQKALSRIVLSSRSQNQYETLVHELNEFAETYNSAGMRKVMDAVLDYAQTKEGAQYLTERVQQYQDAYKRVEQDKTYKGASEEFVFDYLAGVFSSEEGVQDFTEYMTESKMSAKEQKSILETVADFFKEIFDRITSYLEDHVLSDTAKKGLEADAAKAQEIRQMVLEVWQQAEKEYQRGDGRKENNKEKFSMNVPVEETKYLVAVHNLNEEKLLKTLELGGFPMPSIAVTKAELGHSNFGEFSCVFRKETIDPKNKKNKVYGADAWTPTFPSVEYEVNSDEMYEIEQKIDKYVESGIPEEYSNQAKSFVAGLDYNIDRYGGKQGIIERALISYGMKAAYLGSKGKTVQLQEKETRTELNDMEKAISKKLIETFGENIANIAKLSGKEILEYNYEIRKALIDFYSENVMDRETAEKLIENQNRLFIVRQVRNAGKYLENGGVSIKKEIDYQKMQEDIDNRVDKENYKEWLENLFSKIEKSSGLSNGKELFTASGNKKSFKQTHMPFTLENIVKAMLAQNEDVKNVSGFHGIKSIRAAATVEFESIEGIKERSGKLQNIDVEKYNKQRENLDNRLEKVLEDITSQSKRSGNPYIDMDIVGSIILEACNNPTAENVKNKFAAYKWKITDIQSEEIADIIRTVRDMPVNMFEAKPQRVVSFDEIVAILMPNNADQNIKNRISNAGISTVEYEADNDKSRLDALNSLNDVKFSIDVDDVVVIDSTLFSKNVVRKDTKYVENEVLKILKSLSGRSVTVVNNGAKIYFDNYFADEYVHSIDSIKSTDVHKTAKMNASILAEEIVKRAIYAEHSENTKGKKKADASRGFDYYNIKFRIKSANGEKVDFNGILNVRKDRNGKDYAYDFTKIKKGSVALHTDKSDSGNEPFLLDKKITHKEYNVNKKYSINIDDAMFANLENRYSTEEKDIASIVEEGFAALQHVTVDERLMRKIAYDIKKSHQSNYNIEQLTQNLTRVFAYLKDNPNVQYEDMVRIVQEIAKPVLEESTDIDQFQKEVYDNFKSYLKGRKIRLNEEQKAEAAYYYGSYAKYRKLNMGDIAFEYNGVYLDDLWAEICDNAYQLLDYSTPIAERPIALMDVLNTLKPIRHNIFGMNREQAAYDLALDIFRRFFVEQAEESANQKVFEKTARLLSRQKEYRLRVKAEYDISLQRLREVEKEKRKNLAEKYESEIHELKENQKMALAYKDVQRSNEIQKRINQNNKRLYKAKQDASERMLELKAKNRQNMVDKRRNEDMRRYRERIKKNATGIVSYFNTNTNKKHVPEALKDAVAGFITSIDFVSDRADVDSTATLAWQDSLNQMYRKLSDERAAVSEGYEDIYNALVDGYNGDKKVSSVLNDMSAFIDLNSGVKISEMNAYQLEQLDDLITALKRAITSVNQLYVNKRTNDVTELGIGTLRELEERNDKKIASSDMFRKVDNMLDVNMLDARSYFYRLGDNAAAVYDALRGGFSQRVWLLKEAQTYMDEAMDGMNVYNWTGENAKIHTFIVGGKELQMTTAQIMTLYELRNRSQAKMHILRGGIRPTEFKKAWKEVSTKAGTAEEKSYGVGKKATIKRVRPARLTEYELDMICEKLTPQQKQLADAMQKFMAENCAEWGNKTSMQMYGYKRFGAKNYFPIKTDGNSVDTRDDSKFYGTPNQGFTKSTMKNAQNPIIIDDIFNVFTNHVVGMANYSAFTAPLSDAMKWYNFRGEASDGYMDSTKLEIERVYGRENLEYFEKLIKDINAEAKKGSETALFDKFTSNMKAASVGANIRVAIQQPTAYFRAAAVMDPKYLTKALGKKPAVKKARENSAITQWKSWGYFETSIGRSMKDVITGQDTMKNKVVEQSMILAQLGDDVTWGVLWNACEAEVTDKHPELVYDSKEYLEAVAEKFDDVVDQTQVVDSVLHRSHIMRSDKGVAQMATSFMAEPTKSYNLLANAVRDVRENGWIKADKASKKKLGRVVNAYVFTQVINAAVVSIIDAMRDMEDDDRTWWDRYIEALKGNVADNMNPISMIPFAKDIYSLLQGYDVARLDMQGFSNFFAGAKEIYKYNTDAEYREKHTLYSVFKNLARGLSQIVGIPGYNALRDMESLYHTVSGKWFGGIKRSNKRNYELATDALLDGDEEEYERIEEELTERGVKHLDIVSGIKGILKDRYLAGEISDKELLENGIDPEDVKEWEESALLEQYKDGEVKEAELLKKGVEEKKISKIKLDDVEEGYLNGDISQSLAKTKLKKELEMDDDEIFFTLRGWDYKRKHWGASCTQYTILYDAIDKAKASKNINDRIAIQEEIRTLKDHNVEKKNAVAAVTRRYKKAYLEAKKSGHYADMKNLLISVYMMIGLSKSEAMEKIDNWKEEDEEEE